MVRDDHLFKAAYARLNAAQKQAVDQLEGPVLVLAGPGTGKTELLTLRVANILDKTDTLPENILCLTFTESAVTTMRERLSGIIGPSAQNITISTYHSFGSELLQRYPDYFPEHISLRPADDLSIDSTYRSVLQCLPYSNPLKPTLYLADIKQIISDCKRALISPADLRLLAESNERARQALSKLTKAATPWLARLSKTALDNLGALLQVSAELAASAEPIGSIIPLQTAWCDSLRAALTEVQESGNLKALSKWKLAWLEKDEQGEFMVSSKIHRDKLLALATIYEAYRQQLKEQGLYDYDDMILEALKGLMEHTDLRFSLQERYLYLLLDEYQDTNAAQARLVELLTDNPVNEGRPNVLAVGDDDQAIYAFQGANYSHMLRFYEQYRDVSVISLTDNYRSVQAILDFSEQVAEQIETRLISFLPRQTKKLTAHTKTTDKAAIESYDFTTQISQNLWVAQTIQKLLKSGTAANTIAVLAPKHQYLEALMPYLREAKIAVHYEKREDILLDPELHYLLTMCQLVIALQAQQMERAAGLWPEVLSHSSWQLPTTLLWQLSWQAHDEHQPWLELLINRPETRPIGLFFMRLSQSLEQLSLEQILNYLIGIEELPLYEPEQATFRSPLLPGDSSQLTARIMDKPAVWQLLSHLTILREKLYESHTAEDLPLQLNDLVQYVEAHVAAGIKILNTNPYQEASEAVQLMTAYRAKGQEYSTVFLLSAVEEVWGAKTRNQSSRIAVPPNLSFIRYGGGGNDEHLRLLYVALTRAKTQVYISSYHTGYTNRKLSPLSYLHDALLNDKLTSVHPASEVHPDSSPRSDALILNWQQYNYNALKDTTPKAQLLLRLKDYQLSPTDLNMFLDVVHNGPLRFYLQALLRFPVAKTPSAEYGQAIHETLEWIHAFNKRYQALPTLTEITSAYELRLKRKQLNPQELPLLKERGELTLKCYLEQRAHTIVPDALCEYSLRREGIVIDSVPLSGKIDKLLIDPKQKTITIVDYKTGKSHKRWERSNKLHFYQNQLYFYKLLVEHAPSFQGYRVIDAYLEFIEPDENGTIQELHASFNNEHEAGFLELIQAVWRHITALNFPDTSSYPDNLKGIEQFEADLQN